MRKRHPRKPKLFQLFYIFGRRFGGIIGEKEKFDIPGAQLLYQLQGAGNERVSKVNCAIHIKPRSTPGS